MKEIKILTYCYDCRKVFNGQSYKCPICKSKRIMTGLANSICEDALRHEADFCGCGVHDTNFGKKNGDV